MADHSFIMPCKKTLEMLPFIQAGDVNYRPESLDWSKFCVTAEQEGVTGIWYNIIRHTNNNECAPSDVISRLEASYRKTQVRNVLLREALRDVLKRLDEARIPVIILKGAALSELVYGDIGLRPMCDIDLLVRSDQSEQAITLLLAAGYQRKSKPELRESFDRLFRVEVELQTPSPNIQQVEIHWQLLSPLFASRFVRLDEVWERAIPVQIVDQPAFTLGAEDWVLHLAAHAFYKHRKINLQVLYDVDRLIRHQEQNLDWDKLVNIGRRFHWLPALAAVLPLCADALETPIPVELIQSALEYRLPRSERWLLNWWMHPGRSDRSHIYPDWLTLPNTCARLYVLWSYLFPQKRYLDTIYPPYSKWKLPYVYIHRWWDESKAS